MLDKRWRSSYRAGDGLRWTDALTAAGFTLVMVGGIAADSPGRGYLYAGGIVLSGFALAALGQRLEAKGHGESRYEQHKIFGKGEKR